jgi:hypothetical protein
MSILGKVTDFLGGSLFKEIKEGVMAYLPPDLNPQQKAEIELNIQNLLHEKEKEANRALAEANTQLNQRIAEQEGTAKDLMQFGWLGRVVVFLRGMQRPAWGFGTFLIDYQWFFSTTSFTDRQEQTLLVINLLVLGFLFGERAVKNLTPLLVKILGAKNVKDTN